MYVNYKYLHSYQQNANLFCGYIFMLDIFVLLNIKLVLDVPTFIYVTVGTSVETICKI